MAFLTSLRIKTKTKTIQEQDIMERILEHGCEADAPPGTSDQDRLH